jgi:hypothetical protein
VFVLYDDGYGRVMVQVRRRDDGRLVAVSAPALAFSTSAGFARSARTLRWRSRTIVELVPYAGLSAGVAGAVLWSDDRGLVTVDLDHPGAVGGPVELPLDEHHDLAAAVADAPAVVAQIPADLGARIEVVGGGPMHDVPDAYATALHALLDQLNAPGWQTWWSAGSDQVLEMWYDFAAAAAGPAARRSGGRLRTTIRRPVMTFAATKDPAELAREDVDAMLAMVRRRTGLGAPPPLS